MICDSWNTCLCSTRRAHTPSSPRWARPGLGTLPRRRQKLWRSRGLRSPRTCRRPPPGASAWSPRWSTWTAWFPSSWRTSAAPSRRCAPRWRPSARRPCARWTTRTRTRAAAHRLAADAQDFERHRVSTEADLERRWGGAARRAGERQTRARARRARNQGHVPARHRRDAGRGAGADAGGAGGAGGVAQGRAGRRPGTNGEGETRVSPPARTAGSTRPGSAPPGGPSARAASTAWTRRRRRHSLAGWWSSRTWTGTTHAGRARRAPQPAAARARARIDSGDSAPPGPELVFAIGGLAKANAPLWTAEVYEAAHGAWRALPEMSAPRGYLSSRAGARARPGSPLTSRRPARPRARRTRASPPPCWPSAAATARGRCGRRRRSTSRGVRGKRWRP